MKAIFLSLPDFNGEVKELATRFYNSMPVFYYRQRVKLNKIWYVINSVDIDLDQNVLLVELLEAQEW